MSVAIVHQQRIVFARGFGVVDLAGGTRATEKTPYPIASLTKTFAAAVMLVETGTLDLDEAMSTYDSGYPQWCAELKARGVPAARNYNYDTERITVRHHLTHTAHGQPGSSYQYNRFSVRASDRRRGCRVCKGC